MTVFIGRKAEVGIGKETVRGTAATAAFWVPKTELTYDEMVNQVIDESSIGIIEDSIGANISEQIAEGSLEGLVRDKSIGLILLSALGVETFDDDNPEAGVNLHTFTIGSNAQSQSLTISVKEPNASKQFPLAMIDSLEFVAAVQDYVKFTAGFRSKKGSTAVLTPAYTAENLFIAQHATFKHATDLAGLDAASEVNIIRCSISISKNVEDDHNLGSLSPTDILNKQVAIEGEVELLYRDTTYVDYLLADTARALRLRLRNTDVTIGATSNPTIDFDFAKVKFSEVTKPFPNDDLIRQTLSFKAFYSLSDTLALRIKLTNTNAAY